MKIFIRDWGRKKEITFSHDPIFYVSISPSITLDKATKPQMLSSRSLASSSPLSSSSSSKKIFNYGIISLKLFNDHIVSSWKCTSSSSISSSYLIFTNNTFHIKGGLQDKIHNDIHKLIKVINVSKIKFINGNI